MFDDVLL